MMQTEINQQEQQAPGMNYTECYQLPIGSLWNEDCVKTMGRIPDGSIDLLLQDTPFGCTQNDWDVKPNFKELWPEWERIAKPNAAMIFFGTQPFASELIMSNRKMFKYDLIWEKSIATGFLNATKMPLRAHETILVFYKKLPTYNPVKNYLPTTSFKKSNGKPLQSSNYGKCMGVDAHGSKDGSRYPRSVFNVKYESAFFDATKKNTTFHPTQKPLALMRYLIQTYSNVGETVFDGYSGSGTTAEACMIEGRKFIGSELNSEYFNQSVIRLKNVPSRLF